MPTLPIYDHQRQPGVSMPQPAESTQAHIKEAKEAADKVEAFGSLMQSAAVEWQKASDLMDYTRGKSRLLTLLDDNEVSSSDDQDVDNAGMYIENAKKAKSEAMKFIKNQAMAEKAGIEFDRDIKISQLKIDGIFKQKRITNYQANTNDIVNSNADAYLLTETDDQRKTLILDTIDRIKLARNMGAYSEKDYIDAIDNVENWELNRALSDTASSPDNTMEAVKSGEAYTLDEKQKKDYWSKAFDIKKKVKEKEDQLKEYNEGKGALKAATMMADNTLTEVELGKMVQNNEMTDELAAEFFKAMAKTFQVPNDTAVADGYIKILKALAVDKPKAMDAIKATVEAFGDKIIPKDQMAYFLQQADGVLENIGKPPKRSIFGKLADTLGAIKGNATTVWQGFFNKKLEGKTDQQAMSEIKKDVVIENDPSLITAEDPVQEAYNKQALGILKAGGADIISKQAISEIAEQLKYADERGLQVFIANTGQE